MYICWFITTFYILIEMKDKLTFWDKFKSYFIDVIIEEISGDENSTYYVKLVEGKLILDHNKLNISFGSIHRAFHKVFQTLKLKKRNIKSVLILGLGAGSIPSILRHELKLEPEITGVENDNIILDLARKYFHLNDLPKLKIIDNDASVFIHNNDKTFDLIIIDLHKNGCVAEQFKTKEFLNHLKHSLNPSGLIIFNTLVNSKKEKANCKDLQENFHKVFGHVKVIKVRENLSNWMLYYDDQRS